MTHDEMTSELRPALEVWLEAAHTFKHAPPPWKLEQADQAAAAVIEADRQATRAALVAEIVAWLRTEDRRLTDGGAITDADHLADEIEAKWGKQ